jgi:hypothetical protein
MATTSAADNGRRRVVVAPSLAGRGGVNPLKILPIWLGSAVVHGVMLALFYFVYVSTCWGAMPPLVNTEVQNTTDVEDAPKEPDLTNPDIGLDDTVQTNYNNNRIEEVSVPGPVDPTAAVGVLNAPEAAPQTVPAPPGSGGGTGGAPVMAEAGSGATWGSAGGMGGIANLGAFAGRSGATRVKMLQEGGGNALSEAAVARGLEWLALHQAADGHWSLHEFHRHAREKPLPASQTFTCNCEGRVTRRNDVAATAFALLPFLAGGQTHKPSGKAALKDYSKTVAAGLHYLIGKQGKDGYFGGDMYAHGLATIALCEAYGLTSDPLLKGPAQRALNHIVSAQDPSGGGWRYAPRQAGDTSVTGWQLMALKSGQMSGLSVPKQALRKCEQFLDSVESSRKGGYGYTNSSETITMTSVGLLCRQYLGVNPRNPGLLEGVKRLKTNPPGRNLNLYYLYYATQVMHHMGGDAWQFWNLGPDGSGKGGIRDTLLSKQDSGSNPRQQHQKGSWAPLPGTEGGGRIMSTSLSLLCLEVYYRHLPLYRRDLGVIKDEMKK